MRLRCGEVEIEFAPSMMAPKGPDPQDMRSLAEALAGNTMTPEEALFGSAPQVVSREKIAEMLKQMQGG